MTKNRVARRVTPAQIAERAVSEMFDGIIQDRDNIGFEGDAASPFVEGFDFAVREIVEAFRQEGAPATEIDLGVRAGYLLGMQMGLRLRNVGGRP
jgi:hypothetical protein